jgi:hypothetical protein
MNSRAKNPHGFAWDHDKEHQFLVIGKRKIHVAWQMSEAALRTALASLDLVEDILEAAIVFVKEYRIDIDVPPPATV